MAVITASELRSEGLAGIEARFEMGEAVPITVRGEPRYVVIRAEDNRQFREDELLLASEESRRDVLAGRYRDQSADEHIAATRQDLQASKNGRK